MSARVRIPIPGGTVEAVYTADEGWFCADAGIQAHLQALAPFLSQQDILHHERFMAEYVVAELGGKVLSVSRVKQEKGEGVLY